LSLHFLHLLIIPFFVFLSFPLSFIKFDICHAKIPVFKWLLPTFFLPTSIRLLIPVADDEEGVTGHASGAVMLGAGMMASCSGCKSSGD
jgi:hypothetical protein